MLIQSSQFLKCYAASPDLHAQFKDAWLYAHPNELAAHPRTLGNGSGASHRQNPVCMEE